MGHKTQMKLSQGTDARQVASQRRRSGLFKRASELTTLCAVETALVIFTPCGKAVSIVHPGAEPVITNLAPTGMPDSSSNPPCQAHHEATLKALEKQYHDLLEQLAAEKKRGEELQKRKMMSKQRNGRRLWEVPVDELNLEELLKLKAMMEDLSENLKKIMAERSAQTHAPTEGSSVDPNGHVTGPGN